MPEEKRSKHVFPLIIAVIVVVVLLMYVLFFQVRQTEVAVVTTFGKPTANKMDPGLYPKWPWPVQSVYKFDKRLQVFDGDVHETLTADNQVLIVTEVVGWRVVNPREFLESVGTVERARELLKPLVSDAKTKVIAKYVFKDFVSAAEGDITKVTPADKDKLKHREIERNVRALVNESLQAETRAKKWGVKITLIRLKRIELPDTVTEKVFTRMKAERERETSQIRKAGDAASEAIRRRADAMSESILAVAKGEALAIRGQGRAEAAKYYKELNKRPELAIFLRKVAALEKIKERLTLFVDVSMPPFDVLTNEAVRAAAAEVAGGKSTKRGK